MRKERKCIFIEKKYLAVTLLFIAVILFCAKGTVMSREKDGNLADRQYYRVIENEYIGEMRDVLEECGYKNCGITMTKVMEKNMPNMYTVLIHHKRLRSLDENGRESLKTALSGVSFPVEESRFSYVFMESEND